MRIALGATPGHVRRLVLGDAISVVATGAAVGVGAALASSRVLHSMLFQVSPVDSATLVGVTLLLVTVALVAAYMPARLATRTDPVQALRD